MGRSTIEARYLLAPMYLALCRMEELNRDLSILRSLVDDRIDDYLMTRLAERRDEDD